MCLDDSLLFVVLLFEKLAPVLVEANSRRLHYLDPHFQVECVSFFED